MKRFTNIILLALLVGSAAATRAAEKLYALVSYMHIPDGQRASDYMELERIWQRLHQKAVDTGFCHGWLLYRVENGGRNHFATVELYDSLDKIRQRWPASLRQSVFSAEDDVKVRQTGQVRKLTHQEVWQMESAVGKEENESSLPMTVNFIKPKPGKMREYYDMEMKLYRKIQKARVDAGQMLGWIFLDRLLPRGSDGEFDFITMDTFPAGGGAFDAKVAQSAVTKEEWENRPKLTEVREIVRREIWHPMLRTTPRKQKDS